MKKVLTVLSLSLFFLGHSFGQSTWIPEGDYRLYSFGTYANCFGADYTITNSNADSSVMNNYVQFNDSIGIFMMPYRTWNYTFKDVLSPLGQQIYYPQSDQVRLFQLGLLLPNNPKPNETWTALSAYKSTLHIEASSSTWNYSAEYKDTVLSITIEVKNSSNQMVGSDSLNGSVLYYGKSKGLLQFSGHLVSSYSSIGEVQLSFSRNLGIGELPSKPEDVFAYTPGMEVHTINTIYGPGQIDTIYTRRKTLSTKLTGTLLERTDSVWKITHHYTQTGQNTWTDLQVTNRISSEERTEIDLIDYPYFNSSHCQVALNSFDSSNNQLFSIKRSASAISEFELYVGKEMPAEMQVTPNPPYAYISQNNSLLEQDEHFVYYIGAGGPYRRFNSIAGGQNEYVVYVKNGSVEKGTPISQSLLNTLLNPRMIQASAYPNPATNRIDLRTTKSGSYQLSLYDAQGKLMLSNSFEGNEIQVNTKRLNAGVYFMHIASTEGAATLRVQILR